MVLMVITSLSMMVFFYLMINDVLNSYISDPLSSQLKSVSIKTEGDMENLDFRARISLAVLLGSTKEGADWR